MPAPRIFISYVDSDRVWAEWIAWQLQKAGYSTFLSRELPVGSDRIAEWHDAMTKAEQIIVLLSPTSVETLDTQSGLTTSVAQHHAGDKGKWVPIRIRECELRGILAPFVPLDLVGLDEDAARERLLATVSRKRRKPSKAPPFPGSHQPSQGEPSPRFPKHLPPETVIPHRRNIFFTGRESVLESIYRVFHSTRNGFPPPLALCGLVGIGKTQITLEYAYRYCDLYETILWVQADTRDRLNDSFLKIAQRLFPEQQIEKTGKAVQAVKRWLATNTHWLLVLDHINDLSVISSYLPDRWRGHILLTTRSQVTADLANRLPVGKMTQEEGAFYLLRRTKKLFLQQSLEDASQSDRETAKKIWEKLDGVPLALDQAAAYADDKGFDLTGILPRLQARPLALLQQRGGVRSSHRGDFATSILNSLKKIEQVNYAAAELLRFCAFLYPEGIPEEIVKAGVPDFSASLQAAVADEFEMDKAIEELLKHSFISRDAHAKTLSVPYLVQVVQREYMNTVMQKIWAERAIRAVRRVFNGLAMTEHHCQRYVAHIHICITHITRWQVTITEGTELTLLLGQINITLGALNG